MREIPIEAIVDPEVADGKALRTLILNFDGDRRIQVTYEFTNWDADEFDKDMYANAISEKIMEIWEVIPEGSDG
jgi:hypothetical protein